MIIFYISENGPHYITNIQLSIDKYITDIIVKYAFQCGKCEGYYSDIENSNFLIVCVCCNSIYCIKCKNRIPHKNRIWKAYFSKSTVIKSLSN